MACIKQSYHTHHQKLMTEQIKNQYSFQYTWTQMSENKPVLNVHSRTRYLEYMVCRWSRDWITIRIYYSVYFLHQVIKWSNVNYYLLEIDPAEAVGGNTKTSYWKNGLSRIDHDSPTVKIEIITVLTSRSYRKYYNIKLNKCINQLVMDYCLTIIILSHEFGYNIVNNRHYNYTLADGCNTSIFVVSMLLLICLSATYSIVQIFS